MEIKDGMSISRVIDELWQNTDNLYIKEIRVATLQGAFVGEIHQRTSEMLVLKTDARRKVLEGPNKGKAVMQYHCIQLPSIVGISYEFAE